MYCLVDLHPDTMLGEFLQGLCLKDVHGYQSLLLRGTKFSYVSITTTVNLRNLSVIALSFV